MTEYTDRSPETIDVAKEHEPIIMLIPDCCREHWDSCPHVVNKSDYQKKKKRNIGL